MLGGDGSVGVESGRTPGAKPQKKPQTEAAEEAAEEAADHGGVSEVSPPETPLQSCR